MSNPAPNPAVLTCPVPVGRHGMSILAQREGLVFESAITSDCAALWPAVEALLAAGLEVHCLRDLLRNSPLLSSRCM